MLTVSPVSAASCRQIGRASWTRSSRAVVAPASRSTPTPRRYLPRSVGLLDEPVRLQGGDQPERRALVDAELAGDLGDPGLADPGQDLEDGERPVDGLDAGATVSACRVDLRGLAHGRRLAQRCCVSQTAFRPAQRQSDPRHTDRPSMSQPPLATSGDAIGTRRRLRPHPLLPGPARHRARRVRLPGRARRQHPREPAVRRPADGPVLHAHRLRDARDRRTRTRCARTSRRWPRSSTWTSSCGRPGRRTGR